MKKSETGFPAVMEKGKPLQIGFIPDGDCAPIAVARESGLFDKYELNLQLQRETRLSNIRDRMIEGVFWMQSMRLPRYPSLPISGLIRTVAPV